jgi:hypothetical protein
MRTETRGFFVAGRSPAHGPEGATQSECQTLADLADGFSALVELEQLRRRVAVERSRRRAARMIQHDDVAEASKGIFGTERLPGGVC